MVALMGVCSPWVCVGDEGRGGAGLRGRARATCVLGTGLDGGKYDMPFPKRKAVPAENEKFSEEMRDISHSGMEK